MKGLTKSLLGMAVMGTVAVTSVQAVFPLRVDIDVSTKRTNKNIGAGDSGEAKVENITVHVKIRKSGGQPYTEPLTAELYVIGQQTHTDLYGIIGVVKEGFTFSKENDQTFEFSSPVYSLGRTTGNINVGGKYETYLLVVVDQNGEVIDTRSGRNIKDKGIARIRELGPKTLFTKEGTVMGTVENPGEAFKSAIPAAVSSSDD